MTERDDDVGEPIPDGAAGRPEQRPPTWGRRACIALVLLAALVVSFPLVAKVWFMWAMSVPMPAQNPFDRAEWARATSSRYAMVEDLVERHLKPGMPREAVFELLGEVEPRKGTTTLVYSLHARRAGFMPLERACLYVETNEEDCVARAYFDGP